MNKAEKRGKEWMDPRRALKKKTKYLVFSNTDKYQLFLERQREQLYSPYQTTILKGAQLYNKGTPLPSLPPHLTSHLFQITP